MSVGASLSLQPWTVAIETTTVRQFLRAAVLAAGSIGVGCIIYLAEKHGLDSPSRAVRNPADVMMRVLGMDPADKKATQRYAREKLNRLRSEQRA